MQNTIKILVDLKKEIYRFDQAQQGDDVILDITLLENGVAKDLTGETVELIYINANNTVASVTGDKIIVSGNNVKITCPTDCTRSYGIAKFQLKIVSTYQVSTFPIALTIVPSVDQNQQISQNISTILEDLTAKNIECGETLDSLKTWINTGNLLNADLEGNIGTGTLLNADLEDNITTVTQLQTVLSNTINTGNELDTSLEEKINIGNTLDATLKADTETANTAAINLENVIATADTTTYATQGQVAEINSQLAEKAKQLAFKDFYTPISNISPKLVYNTNGVVFIVTRKPNGKGFIRFKLREGVFTTTESIGSPAELLRVMEVYNVPQVFLYKKIESANSDSNVWADSSINYTLSSGAYASILCKSLNTKTINAWIEYTITIPQGVNKTTALIYGSTGASGNVNISVDGTNVLTGQSFTKTTSQWFTLDIPVTPGTHTIRFTTLTSAFMTIGGVNYQDFSKYNDGLAYDKSAVFFEGSANAYVTADGAMDYALFDSDLQKWCGSYHGGETRNRFLMLLDNSLITLNDGDLLIGNILEIEQDTNINNKINAYSRYIFKQDGAIEFEVVFDGNINLTKMFTNMSTTSELYNDILYPIRKTLLTTDVGNHMLPSGINYIIQRNSINNQKAITILNNNMYPNDRVPVPYIKKTTGAYNKVYNANIDSLEPINFKSGNFRTIHIYE